MVSHATVLRGLDGPSALPLIVKRVDEDFINGIMRDAASPHLSKLLATRATDMDKAGTLRLFQPVHRVFNLVVVEALCATPGEPRLAREKITSAGAVIRRVRSSPGSGPFGEGWMVGADGPVGWRRINSASESHLDPDPELRHLPDQGNAAINRLVHDVVKKTEYGEEVVTLFVAPDEVCAATGKTLLFGLVPTASDETGEALPVEDPYNDSEIDNMLPRFLRAGIAPTIDAIANQWFTYEQAEAVIKASGHEFSDAASPPDDVPTSSDSQSVRAAKQMHGFVAMLKVLAIQLDAFGDGADAKKLRELLSQFSVDGRPADQLLADAATALVLEPGTGRSVLVPSDWPAVSVKLAERIRTQFRKMLAARFSAFTPRATRFDDPNAQFQIHPFIRVRSEDDCPDQLVWSKPSARYQVAPWFDNSSTAPTLVRLPALDRQSIKKLKPNVAFVVPKSLMNLLSCNSPKDFMDGKGKDCGNVGLDWICGFNIPIITLCAFIVLNIFLTLFNIIFFWLPFIKICFPIPSKLKELASPET